MNNRTVSWEYALDPMKGKTALLVLDGRHVINGKHVPVYENQWRQLHGEPSDDLFDVYTKQNAVHMLMEVGLGFQEIAYAYEKLLRITRKWK